MRSKAEILSKIELARDGALGNRLAVPLEEEFALAEEVDAVDDVEGLADVVVGDQDAHAALAQVLDDLLYIGNGERVDARERLIEQDELRLKRKAARDLDATALAARELRAATVADVPDVELLEESVELVLLLRLRELRRLKNCGDVLRNGELAEYGRLLREIADAQLRTPNMG